MCASPVISRQEKFKVRLRFTYFTHIIENILQYVKYGYQALKCTSAFELHLASFTEAYCWKSKG